MPRYDTSNDQVQYPYQVRELRTRKRPNYVSRDVSPSASPEPSSPQQKRVRTSYNGIDTTREIKPRGGTRAGSGRQKRQVATPLDAIVPRERARTVLGERDNNVDGGNYGGIRDGAGRKSRAAADARVVNTTPYDIGPVNTTPRDVAAVNIRMEVVVSQRDPMPASTYVDTTEPVQTEFQDIDLLAPPPQPEYSERTLRHHARQERTTEDRGLDQPTRQRGPYRPRAVATYKLCRDPAAAKDAQLFTIDQGFKDASNTCPYCDAQCWRAERKPNDRWPCCDNGKNDWPMPDQLYTRANVDEMPDGPEKVRELMVRQLDDLMYDTELVDGGPKKRRTARSKEFMENIVSYNNSLSFTSEAVDNVDYNMGRTTFRIQGSVYHRMGPLLPDTDERAKFAQIYILDGTQEQLDTRQYHSGGVNPATLAQLQRLLRSINPYAQGFKNCYDRIKEDEERHPIETMSIRIQQLDPKRQNKGTHNRPTSSEVARVMITPTDGKKSRIERDIRVETKEGGLMRVPEYHPAYMALRYVLMYPFGEQSWHQNIGLAGRQLPTNHLLHASRRNRVAGTLTHHNFHFSEDPEEEVAPNDPDQEEDLNEDGERAPRGRGGGERVTRRQFYAKAMQVRAIQYSISYPDLDPDDTQI